MAYLRVATYSPPDHLISISGMSVDQLTAEFKAFKNSLRTVPNSPELIFERVIANVFTVAPRSPEDYNLEKSLEPLHVEILQLREQLTVIKNTIAAGSNPAPEAPPAAPIGFSFVEGGNDYLGIRADSYDYDDGLYGIGCKWHDLGGDNSDLQYGSYNTVNDSLLVPLESLFKRKITFSRPFTAEPIVVVWLTGVDVRGHNIRKVETFTQNASKTDFELCIRSSEECSLYSVGVSWVAYPWDNSNLDEGTFTAQVYASCHRPGSHNLALRSPIPHRAMLAVYDLVLVGDVKMPIVLDIMGIDSETILWCLRDREHGSGFCSLGVRFITRLDSH